MLKIYDSNKNALGYIIKYKNLEIESDLYTGDKSLSFVYLAKKTKDIQNEYYLETKTDRYVVKEIGISTEGFPEFHCQLDLEDLEADVFEAFSALECSLTEAANLALAGTGWTVETDIVKIRCVATLKATPLAILGKIRDAWMCEMQFDNKNKIVRFCERFGEDRGVFFVAGLNLKNTDLTIDSYEYYTRLIPIGKDNLRINSVNDGKRYVENFQYSNKIKTCIWEDSSYTDPIALKEDAEKKLEELSKPKKSYGANIIDLAKARTEYTVMSFELGDTVLLLDEKAGIKEKQRIVKLTEYPQNSSKNKCELSNITLTFTEQQAKLEAAAAALENISNADGTVNGIYVHGVEANGIVGIETVVSNSEPVQEMTGKMIVIREDIDTLSSEMNATKLRVGTLETTYLKATDAELTYATIKKLEATTVTINNLTSEYATFKTTTTTELSAQKAAIESLEASRITTDYLEANYAQINLANIQSGCITTAQIADGSITDAKIVGLTANKITAGTLDAGTIEVINLNAANITVGTINGQQIATGAIDTTKLTSSLATEITTAGENASKALHSAGSAQTTADGKNTVFYQASEPVASGRRVNDVWFDTDDGNKMYYWTGTNWESREFGTNAIEKLAITNALIADATIQSAKIANMDAGKITSGFIDAARINAATIVALHLAAGAVTTDKIAASAITTDTIAASAITTDKIVAAAITGEKIAAKTINANNIAAGTITANELCAGAITTDKLAANAVTAEKINVDDLFAQDIIATGIIRGATIVGGEISTTNALTSDCTEIRYGKITQTGTQIPYMYADSDTSFVEVQTERVMTMERGEIKIEIAQSVNGGNDNVVINTDEITIENFAGQSSKMTPSYIVEGGVTLSERYALKTELAENRYFTQTGNVSNVEINAGSRTEIEVTFDTPFSEPPVVCIDCGASGYVMSTSFIRITATIFKAWVFNETTSTLAGRSLFWTAIGKM